MTDDNPILLNCFVLGLKTGIKLSLPMQFNLYLIEISTLYMKPSLFYTQPFFLEKTIGKTLHHTTVFTQ